MQWLASLHLRVTQQENKKTIKILEWNKNVRKSKCSSSGNCPRPFSALRNLEEVLNSANHHHCSNTLLFLYLLELGVTVVKLFREMKRKTILCSNQNKLWIYMTIKFFQANYFKKLFIQHHSFQNKHVSCFHFIMELYFFKRNIFLWMCKPKFWKFILGSRRHYHRIIFFSPYGQLIRT